MVHNKHMNWPLRDSKSDGGECRDANVNHMTTGMENSESRRIGRLDKSDSLWQWRQESGDMTMEPRCELLSNAVEMLIPLQPASGDLPRSPDWSAHHCLASLDTELSVVAATDDFFQQFGKSSAEVCGSSLYELLQPQAQDVLAPHFAALTDGEHNRFNERVLATGGGDGAFAGELIGMAIRDDADQLLAIVVLLRPDAAAARDTERTVQPIKARAYGSGRRKSLLTALDARILEGVAAGASTIQLATRLYLSRQGVEYHVGSMLRKLRVSNRAALVSRAYAMGLLVADAWPPRISPEVANAAA
jgi:DNA-binding CsgD family transcriptional regulator